MYHSRITFWIAGIRRDYVQEWKKLEPLERFEHEIRELSDLSQLKTGKKQVVIFL